MARSKEEERARLRAHYLEHQEEIKERSRRYRATHKKELAEYFREYRARKRKELSEYNQEYRAKRSRKTGGANHKINNAIKEGKVSRLPCEVCGGEPAEAHHDDYNKPLDVRWLCKKCHTEWHKYNKPKYIGDD